MRTVFLRTAHNYDTDKASDEAGLNFNLDDEPSLTQQQFKEETDINTIVQRFGITGELPENYQPPISGDFTNISTFEEAMLATRKAIEQFMELPGTVRERFDNDPGKLIAFLDRTDDVAKAEALALGITQPPPERIRTTTDAIDELKTVLTTPKT